MPTIHLAVVVVAVVLVVVVFVVVVVVIVVVDCSSSIHLMRSSYASVLGSESELPVSP